MKRVVVGLVLLAPLSCAHHGAGQRAVGHETPHVPGIRIIKRADADRLGLKGTRRELRFGDRQDGTKLVLDFLDEAKRAGGKYVSDIRIVLVTQRNGELVACETRLAPFAKKESYKVPHQTPARTEQRVVTKPVTRTVTEYQYQCRMVSRPVTRTQTTYQYQYDYASKSSRSVPVTRTVTSYEYHNDCRSVPVTRTVTRYEHQIETKYIPPRLTYLSAHYTDFDLIESMPSCEPVPDGPARDGKLPHRLVGIVYK